ncbi:methyltransferase GidB [Granulicella mallensis MP5ACTX8]|uniref:Ribosomal RNA small subunit methyltransferase G n=2 Tax=Granulicella mallensis TaxID=940614 RepID=G8NZP8_GRAMM|nr:methyltransferase GidB [Granulicella mallensis MP5ACTX8]
MPGVSFLSALHYTQKRMPTLTEARIADLLAPYTESLSMESALYGRLSQYLDLLLRWNAKTNLTAIREPEEIVRRHFGESLFAARHLASRLAPEAALLDFGSGAGFPGLPIQLLLPELRVTLAESQGKKASFLREAVRTLGLATEVWSARVESMPAERRFDAVTLRAVDHMQEALAAARPRVVPGGWLVTLSASRSLIKDTEQIAVPGSGEGWLTMERISE